MGACSSSNIKQSVYIHLNAPYGDTDEFHDSLMIQRALDKQESKKQSSIKLLLLGTGNAGKSTIMKQFKIFHGNGNGFSPESREEFKHTIWKSAIVSIRLLVLEDKQKLFEDGHPDSPPQHSPIKYHRSTKNRVDSEVSSLGEFKVNDEVFDTDEDDDTASLRDISEAEEDDEFMLEDSRIDDGIKDGEDGLQALQKASSSIYGLQEMDQEEEEKQRAGYYFTDFSNYLCNHLDSDTPLCETIQVPINYIDDDDARRHLNGGNDITVEEESKSDGFYITIKVGEFLKRLWLSKQVQDIVRTNSKSINLVLEAPIEYIMKNIERIQKSDYVPSSDDILMARKKTTGVNTFDFVDDRKRFKIIDVGGQRTERRKWLNQFDGVDAVLFVVGLDQYDQVLIEDGHTNRLRDSLVLFKEMCSSPWFRYTNFLLYFNKRDIFKEKIKRNPLTECFNSYKGDPHDYQQCVNYTKKRFTDTYAAHVQELRDDMARRKREFQKRRRGELPKDVVLPAVFARVTCATDTDDMKFVIIACQAIFLRKGMWVTGLAS